MKQSHAAADQNFSNVLLKKEQAGQLKHSLTPLARSL
jgi:hypothetical protein